MSTVAETASGLALRLSEAAATGDSGILTAQRGKLKRLFCLDRGRLVWVASNVIEEQVGEILVQWKLLDVGDLIGARTEASDGSIGVTRALVNQEALDEATLREAQEDHFRHLLFDTMDWSDGEIRFDRGKPDLSNEVTLELSITELLMEYSRHNPRTVDETRVRLGSPSTRPVVSKKHRSLLESLRPSGAVKFLLEKSDGSVDIESLVTTSPEPTEDTYRALYGLLLCGILRPKREELPEDDHRVTRAEMMARLEKSRDADHYMVLELNPTAERDEVREAYYYLARRYHPDRFRTGDLQDLLDQVETYFTQVTEAYNTLYDDELRAAYDESRSKDQGTDTKDQDTAYLARQNFARARLLIERGKLTEAVGWLENALKLDGARPEYRLELGRLLTGNPRRRPEAEKHLIEVNQLDPALVDGYVALGELYVRMKRTDDAARQFREALRWEPGHLVATDQLEKLGKASGQ